MRGDTADIRHDWTHEEVAAIYGLPLTELVFRAQAVHRQHFAPDELEACVLLNIKSGGCPEDCAYCSQSARHDGPQKKGTPMLTVAEVRTAAREAKQRGATRFCMGAAFRAPKQRQLEQAAEMIVAVREEGLETCMTLGMLDEAQARFLKQAGLDYYNHNIDTSPEYYGEIITTRSMEDRLTTLRAVAAAGINICCGGIIGLGETRADRISMLHLLATLPAHPASVPINRLVAIEGTPLANATPPEPFEMVRTIATARILMPRSRIRLAAGRREMSDEAQALCYLAGANSIFLGERLLTTGNPAPDDDEKLFHRLGMKLQVHTEAN